MEIRSTVPSNMNGVSLLTYLTSRFTYLTQEQWLVRISEKRFSIDGTPASKDDTLCAGQVVTYEMPEHKEPPADLNYSVVFEDEHLLAVNKPGNLLVHKSGRSIRSNLIYLLREEHVPPLVEAHIVNRLDRETSGLVLVAKSKRALKTLNYLFQERLVKKEYHAIVDGAPATSSGVITWDICDNPESSIRSKHRVGERGEGKQSSTAYELVRSGPKHSLLRLQPQTGRVHQLRLHAASIGCPIIGDKLYNMDEALYLQWQKDRSAVEPFEVPRQMLHCNNLQFTLWDKAYNIDAPLPDDFLRQLSLKVDL